MLEAEVKSLVGLSGEERGRGGVRLWSQTDWLEIAPLMLLKGRDLRQFAVLSTLQFPVYKMGVFPSSELIFPHLPKGE